jgi:hypothetical protein
MGVGGWGAARPGLIGKATLDAPTGSSSGRHKRRSHAAQVSSQSVSSTFAPLTFVLNPLLCHRLSARSADAIRSIETARVRHTVRCTVASWPLVSQAQSPASPVIGLLSSANYVHRLPQRHLRRTAAVREPHPAQCRFYERAASESICCFFPKKGPSPWSNALSGAAESLRPMPSGRDYRRPVHTARKAPPPLREPASAYGHMRSQNPFLISL